MGLHPLSNVFSTEKQLGKIAMTFSKRFLSLIFKSLVSDQVDKSRLILRGIE